jgi:MoxR-like ATPase
MQILARHHAGFGRTPLEAMGLSKLANEETLLAARDAVDKVMVKDEVARYIAEIVRRTRGVGDVRLGASPRAGVNLLIAAKTQAALRGRDFATPDDVKDMVLPVLRHRLMLTAEAEIEGTTTSDVLASVLAGVPVPR